MEATFLHSSTDQGSMASPCKRGRNPKRGPHTRSYISSRSRTHSTTPNLYHSESLPKIGYLTNPPLLPLPTSGSGSGGGGGGGSRGSSLSPAHKKHNKLSKKSPAMKPEPDCLPKGIKNKKVLFAEDVFVNFIPKQEEKFSGTAFPSAPPPSSLPMPKFSMKPKMSCKVEATTGSGGLIDAGATDNLCRLLNIR